MKGRSGREPHDGGAIRQVCTQIVWRDRRSLSVSELMIVITQSNKQKQKCAVAERETASKQIRECRSALRS